MSVAANTNPLAVKAIWIERVLMTLVILPFAMSAVFKLLRLPAVVESLARVGFPRAAIAPLAVLELACLVLYLIPRTAVLGAFLLTGYLGGAIVANIILHTNLVLPIVLGLLVWTAAWLRVHDLRELLPFTREDF